jgi:myo-inositol-1(or 4)-monophosphatase
MEVKRPAGLPAVDLHALLALAKDTAALAAAIHREKLGTVHRVGTKSSRTDIITEVDREAEQVIVGALAKARPDDAIVAEEGSARQGTSGIRWLVDPLDGSVNYVYGYPAFSVSIGVEVDGQPRVGVVHDSFYGRVYSAVIGRGAICDGVPLAVSQVEELPDALLATGFGYDADVRAWQAQKLARVLPRVRFGVHRPLSACRWPN